MGKGMYEATNIQEITRIIVTVRVADVLVRLLLFRTVAEVVYWFSYFVVLGAIRSFIPYKVFYRNFLHDRLMLHVGMSLNR